MARPAMFLALAALLIGTCMAGRQLLESADDYCTCEPYVEDRTPTAICNARAPDGEFCNIGLLFPIQGSNCSHYFQCVPAATTDNSSVSYTAIARPCGDNKKFDVLKNTCTAPLFIDNKEVCTSQCLGFMYKPKDGCYHLPSTNSGAGAKGLFNTGANAIGCGNSAPNSVGIRNTGDGAAGCASTGASAWGIKISGSGSCVDGATQQSKIFTVDTLSG